MKIKFLPLILFIAVTQLAGFLGAVFTTSAIPTWYQNINKPAFTPPGWVFAPVWTILYLMMAVAVYLVWLQRETTPDFQTAFVLFFIQLALNSLWSILFFGLQDPLAALIEIVVLWVALVLTIWNFYKINTWAAVLLLPYLIWSTFAAFLNYSIVVLN